MTRPCFCFRLRRFWSCTMIDFETDTRPTVEDVIEALRLVRESDDANRWQAGDLVAAWLEQVGHGRRKSEMIRAAAAAGYTYAGLRERLDCSNFWPWAARRWPVAWSFYNRARRGVEI